MNHFLTYLTHPPFIRDILTQIKTTSVVPSEEKDWRKSVHNLHGKISDVGPDTVTVIVDEEEVIVSVTTQTFAYFIVTENFGFLEDIEIGNVAYVVAGYNKEDKLEARVVFVETATDGTNTINADSSKAPRHRQFPMHMVGHLHQ